MQNINQAKYFSLITAILGKQVSCHVSAFILGFITPFSTLLNKFHLKHEKSSEYEEAPADLTIKCDPQVTSTSMEMSEEDDDDVDREEVHDNKSPLFLLSPPVTHLPRMEPSLLREIAKKGGIEAMQSCRGKKDTCKFC